jgi:hypothetical protein
MADQRERIMQLPMQTRDLYFDGVNKDSRLIHFSFSSSQKARRRFGWEVLSHKPGSANVERIARGACPFLKDHDWTLQAGVVQSCQLTPEKNYAVAKLFSTRLGDELLTAISEGRNSISCGYIVNSMELTEGAPNSDDATYTVSSYEVIELSSVSVPLDINCRVGGRSFDEQLGARLYDCRVLPSLTARSGEITPEDERELLAEIRREYFEEIERERLKAISDQAEKLQYYLF